MARLTFISDPGHGWLAVPLAEYPDALDYGTGYGYLDANTGTAYLEEDCEAPAFMRAHGLTRDEVHVRILRGDWRGRLLPKIPNRMAV